MMASVSGRRSVISEPWPAVLATSMLAAQAVDRALHHVHADAAAGQAGHLARGREAGLEDDLEQFVVGEPGAGRPQAVLLGAGADALAIEAASVVGRSR